MARVLHGMSIDTLPEQGEIKDTDQMVAYRSEDGKAYRTDVASLVMGDFVDRIYPVGSIYMSVNATDPGNIFGGKWEQIKDRFLLAAGGGYSAGAEGGSSAVSLSTDNLPSHTHSMPSHTHSIPSLSGTASSAGSHTHNVYTTYANGNILQSGGSARGMGLSSYNDGTIATLSSGSHTHSVTTNSSTTGSASGTSGATGSGSAFDIMPPYLAVYMWQRVS